jgi:hypothetical protein
MEEKIDLCFYNATQTVRYQYIRRLIFQLLEILNESYVGDTPNSLCYQTL